MRLTQFMIALTVVATVASLGSSVALAADAGQEFSAYVGATNPIATGSQVGNAVLSTAGKRIKCTGAKVTGKIPGAAPNPEVASIAIVYSGCEVEVGVNKCKINSRKPNKGAGEIEMNSLRAELIETPGSATSVGVDLEPPAGEPFTELEKPRRHAIRV